MTRRKADAETEASLAYVRKADQDSTIAAREAELRSQVEAGGLDPADEILPADLLARVTELESRQS